MDNRAKSKYTVSSCLVTQYKFAKEDNPELTIDSYMNEIMEITKEMILLDEKKNTNCNDCAVDLK